MWDCVICNDSSVINGVVLTEKYNIQRDYKIKNINIDIAIFEKDILVYCIIFRKHLIEKLPEKIKWFYYDPGELLKEMDDSDKEEYKFYCNESNGKYCYTSFCIDEMWLTNLPIIKNEYDKCLNCKDIYEEEEDFFQFSGIDSHFKNLPEDRIRFCNECIYGNCRDKLEKYMNRKITPIHNNHKTYLNVPYHEKDIAKKLGAKWCGEKKKWYIYKYGPVSKRDLFSRWNKKSCTYKTSF